MNPPSTKIAVALHVKTVHASCLTPRFFIPVEAANLGATISAIFLSSCVPLSTLPTQAATAAAANRNEHCRALLFSYQLHCSAIFAI